ncbi:hypothetical protein [uncultured Leifsonia sp.]|uniref:hypothetical protein n=1 Tax=uncultured Leifsonia sp. TaxID=340359 RepID=UPI0028D3819B|nr:hypothetical protein [uncultured Leifsonia sp.]
MTSGIPVSRCCRGLPLDYKWFGENRSAHGEAIDGALAAFYDAMHREGLRWNPYRWAAARAEFRGYLLRGIQGDLTPVNEVKKIDPYRNDFLYEIRFKVKVDEPDEKGNAVFRAIPVRAYHGEPEDPQFTFVGLHVHEKVIVRDDKRATNDLQNVEIDKAIELYLTGVPTNWV